jgi:hypothetical protein
MESFDRIFQIQKGKESSTKVSNGKRCEEDEMGELYLPIFFGQLWITLMWIAMHVIVLSHQQNIN